MVIYWLGIIFAYPRTLSTLCGVKTGGFHMDRSFHRWFWKRLTLLLALLLLPHLIFHLSKYSIPGSKLENEAQLEQLLGQTNSAGQLEGMTVFRSPRGVVCLLNTSKGDICIALSKSRFFNRYHLQTPVPVAAYPYTFGTRLGGEEVAIQLTPGTIHLH